MKQTKLTVISFVVSSFNIFYMHTRRTHENKEIIRNQFIMNLCVTFNWGLYVIVYIYAYIYEYNAVHELRYILLFRPWKK